MTAATVDSGRLRIVGYPVDVTDRDVTIFDKRTGRKLATVASIGAARRFLKGYRRDDIHATKAEPAAKPVRATAGSDKEES